MGASNFTQKTEQLRIPYINTETFLVQNRTLGLRFIGVVINDSLKLVPLASFEFENVSFKQGQEVSARDVFTALAPIAKKWLDRKYFKGRVNQ